MYCDRCGTSVQPEDRFCRSCGKSFEPAGAKAAPPPPPASAPPSARYSRLASHLRILGIAWIVVSVFRLMPALAMIFTGGMMGPFGPRHMGVRFPFFPGFLGGFGIVLLLSVVIGLIAGWGLIERQPWARTLAIVMGVLALLDIPFGTALGIYTLWVLLPAESQYEYERIQRA